MQITYIVHTDGQLEPRCCPDWISTTQALVRLSEAQLFSAYKDRALHDDLTFWCATQRESLTAEEYAGLLGALTAFRAATKPGPRKAAHASARAIIAASMGRRLPRGEEYARLQQWLQDHKDRQPEEPILPADEPQQEHAIAA